MTDRLSNWKHLHGLARAEAERLETSDPVVTRRAEFAVPPSPNGRGDAVYLCGNSLGLQPRSARAMIERHLDDWAKLAVEAHFHGHDPWKPYHEWFAGPASRLIGGNPSEVVMMNSLTANLHLLMASFYQPASDRFRILIDSPCFPSDVYAVKSQLRFHGIDEADGLVTLRARQDEHVLRTEDVVDAIGREGRTIALVLLPGVNYATGQFYDIEAITKAAHKAGCLIGWDLAHAAGNLPLKMHDWNVDFAAWCTYKYLNSGPGAVAGAFVHEKWWTGRNAAAFSRMPRFEGWWGNNAQTRFQMRPEFDPIRGAEAWSLSNPPILAMAPLKASLLIFDDARIEKLRERSIRLTGFLEKMLRGLAAAGEGFEIITPADPAQRGAQLSLMIRNNARAVLDKLVAKGIYCDFREPNVIRAAPTPLYNTFMDCWLFTEALAEAMA